MSKALELDNTLGEAHASLAHIKMQYERDVRGAEREYLHAISLSPNYALAHMWYALFQAQSGQLEQGLARLPHLQRLEPLFLGIEQLRGVLKADPGMDHARSFLGRAYLRKGDYEAAINEFQLRNSLSVGSYADLASPYALAGHKEKALAELND